MDWLSFLMGSIVGPLVVAGALGAFRWWRRPRGRLSLDCKPLGAGNMAVTVRWTGAGEAWDALLVPHRGGVRRATKLEAHRLVDGGDELKTIALADDNGRLEVDVLYRAKPGGRARGLRADLVAGTTVALGRRDLPKRGMRRTLQ